MSRSTTTTRALFGAMLAILVWASAAGCAREQRAGAVNPELARDSLRAVLESWKRGEAPDRLRHASPAITIQDLDWKAGYKLLGYEIVGEGIYDTINLRCAVNLTLRDPQGRSVAREVTYVVGTDPSITVFREMPF